LPFQRVTVNPPSRCHTEAEQATRISLHQRAGENRGTALAVVFVGIVGLIGPLVCGAYVYFQRRQRKLFISEGIEPLRKVAAEEIRMIKAPDSGWGVPAAR
jgi:hypothetical protein